MISPREDPGCLPEETSHTVFPKPPDLWSKGHQHALLGLFFVFSVAWALEQCVVFFWVIPTSLMAICCEE